MASVQALIGVEVVFTNFTEPVSPLPQSEETRNCTRTPLLMKSASGEEAVGGSGVGEGVGEFLGVGEGMGVGAGAGGGVSPERDTRISPGWSPPGEATKPKSTCPPTGILEFQPEWLSVLVFPFRETSLAFQIEEIAEGIVIWTDQFSMAAEPVFFRTSDPLNPDPQSESIRVVATSEAKEWAAVSARVTAAMVQVCRSFFIRRTQTAPEDKSQGRLDESAEKPDGTLAAEKTQSPMAICGRASRRRPAAVRPSGMGSSRPRSKTSTPREESFRRQTTRERFRRIDRSNRAKGGEGSVRS